MAAKSRAKHVALWSRREVDYSLCQNRLNRLLNSCCGVVPARLSHQLSSVNQRFGDLLSERGQKQVTGLNTHSAFHYGQHRPTCTERTGGGGWGGVGPLTNPPDFYILAEKSVNTPPQRACCCI